MPHGHLAGDPAASGRRLEITRGTSSPALRTDEALLVRVLVNMMKNALEASSEGGVVKAWAEPVDGGCELRVWNKGAVDPKAALQVFRRSFSTKAGSGRGLGTFMLNAEPKTVTTIPRTKSHARIGRGPKMARTTRKGVAPRAIQTRRKDATRVNGLTVSPRLSSHRCWRP